MQIDEGFTAIPTEQLLRLKNVVNSAESVLKANNEATTQCLRQDVELLRDHGNLPIEFLPSSWDWNLFVDVDSHGKITATLVQVGKLDYSVELHKDQMPWFNALREGLRKEGHLLYRPEKESE